MLADMGMVMDIMDMGMGMATVGATQAWTTLQGLLGVTATGALDQATFQALLSNNNHALLAQQLLAVITTPLSGK
ncbi:unnamed protein product [Rotaria sp. Silwood1]|nr:unnamed protein product [Rotaria sp. Silwood1]CAF4528994.1 unnamed protein product [Rotaria sp. Silwood1]CAF4742400.1 unnamed protein product [Rotaria sp. Silwood1]CAF4923841.1 unnamed protein product [Rotaria sp. Silwood1]